MNFRESEGLERIFLSWLTMSFCINPKGKSLIRSQIRSRIPLVIHLPRRSKSKSIHPTTNICPPETLTRALSTKNRSHTGGTRNGGSTWSVSNLIGFVKSLVITFYHETPQHMSYLLDPKGVFIPQRLTSSALSLALGQGEEFGHSPCRHKADVPVSISDGK